MTKTYCGKDCSVCIDKESLSCTGCTNEENRALNKDCEIVDCCVKKGHEECGTCGFREGCPKLARQERMSSDRIKQREEENKRKAEAARKAPVMAKWMRNLFWFSCVSVILNIVVEYGLDGIMNAEIFAHAMTVIYSVILFKIAKVEELYKTAGYCGLASAVIGIITVWICKDMQEQLLVSVVALVPAILGFVYEFCEFMGHASVVKEANAEMSEKWKTLWKWYVGMIIATVCCILFILISPVLGAMVTLAAAVGLLVISIMKLVYLHETAEIFQRIIDRNGVE